MVPLAGTTAYTAPELLADPTLSATFASDMCAAPAANGTCILCSFTPTLLLLRTRRYAFGLIVWCLFSGRVDAWADEAGRLPSRVTLIRSVSAGLRPDLSALRDDTPGELAPLIRRCWAEDAPVRPRAKEVADELEALLARVRCVLRFTMRT